MNIRIGGFRPRSRHGLLLGAALILPAGALPALAQERAPADETAGNNEILVTAQRRTERLEEVPMSVSVVNQATLETNGVTSLRDLSNVTSGFSLGAGGVIPQPAIRGITTVVAGAYENNVAIYIDGLYQTSPTALNIDLPNIDNVQILKGPQGSLYGRNATGGAVLLTTISPTDAWHGKAELTYARFDDKRATGYVAGPISDNLGVSLAGYIRRSDGYVQKASRTTPGATECCALPIEQDALRAKLVFHRDDFKATLSYAFTRVDDSRSSPFTPIENVPATSLNAPTNTLGYGNLPGGLTRPTTLGIVAYDLDPVAESKQHEIGLTLEWDTGIGKLRSITGRTSTQFRNAYDFDGSYIRASYSSSLSKETTIQETVDFAIDSIKNVDLIVGGNFFRDHYYFEIPNTAYSGLDITNPGTTPSTLADYFVVQQGYFDQTKTAWALFGDVTWHATDRLSITAGGRYSEEVQDISAYQTSALVPSSVRNLTVTSAKFSKFTPRASIRYEISPRTNVYFTYSQGFRSGVFNSTLPACVNTTAGACYQPAKQETIDSFELGFKTAGRNFHAELAGFYYNYKNIQVSTTTTVGTPPTVLVTITNAPKARVYGIEASFDWEPIENLTIRGNATWLDAKYGDGFFFGGVGVNCASPTVGGAINSSPDFLKTCLNVTQSAQNLSGKQMARAPSFSGNLGVDYLIPMGEGGVRLAANVKYTSSYVLSNPSVWGNGTNVPADMQGVQRFRENGYALLNASITWTDRSGHYYVRAWGTNLTDHRYRLHYSGTASNGTYSPMAEPLSAGGTIGYKF